MTTIVYSKSVIAIPRKLYAASGSVSYEPFETFGTPYGMFIPISASGFQFLRWVRSGCVDKLPDNCSIYAWLIHISNSGEVLLICADTNDDCIGAVPYCSKKFSLLALDRDSSEAFNMMMDKFTNIAQAVAFVENNHVTGMPNPQIVFVKDWVAYAEDQGYDKVFYTTQFSDKL